MIREINIREKKRAQEIWDLQQIAYSKEAEWLGTSDLPPLKESIEALQHCEERFLVYIIEGKIVGVLSFKQEAAVLDLHRLFVSPQYFRKGLAKALLMRVEQEAHEKIIVMTGTQNQPAVKFYLKHGFEQQKTMELSPTLSLTTFQKMQNSVVNRGEILCESK
ncbi:GNAT family N-acetyltransferase [Enterococcus sp. LJL98]